MCLSVCLFVCLCLSVCLSVFVFACAYVRAQVYVYVSMRVYVHTYYMSCSYWKVNHLKVVLEKKRDPVSQVSLIETVKKVN